MQEIEIEPNFNCELLSIPGYRFESEKNDVKKRVGIYIKNLIKYERLEALEDRNSHSIVIDIVNGSKGKICIIGSMKS